MQHILRGFAAAGALVLAAAAASPAAAFNLPADPTPIDAGAALTWVVRPDAMAISVTSHDWSDPRGRAVVECVIARNGRPADCNVIEADKGAHNIGRLTAKVAALYKAASKDAAGQPSPGRRVRFELATSAAGDL